MDINADSEFATSLIISLLASLFGIVGIYLSYKNNIKLELHKREGEEKLNKNTFTYQTFHLKRAEAVHKISGLLYRLDNDVSFYINPFRMAGDPNDVDRIKNIQNSFKEFMEFYIENKILLAPKTCNHIDDFIKKIRKSIQNYKTATIIENRENFPNIDKARDFKDEAENIVHEEIPIIINIINEDFRNLLGNN